MQCRKCARWLADRCRLKESVRRHRLIRGYVSETVRARPDNPSVVEERDAYGWHFVELHALAEFHCASRLSLDDNCGKQAVFDASDASRTAFVLSLLWLPEHGSAISRGVCVVQHQAGGEREKCD